MLASVLCMFSVCYLGGIVMLHHQDRTFYKFHDFAVNLDSYGYVKQYGVEPFVPTRIMPIRWNGKKIML